MANEFQAECSVSDTDIANAMIQDAELFACVFHELSEINPRRRSTVLQDVAAYLSPDACAYVRELVRQIDLVEAKP